jgi:hypothetical protein
LDFNPRNKSEVDHALSLLKFVETQAVVQRDNALAKSDFTLVYMMESERVGAHIAMNAIMWALNMSNNFVLDSGTVAAYEAKLEEMKSE